LPALSLEEGEKVGIDRVCLRGRHAMREVEQPFYHLELDERVFPEDVYASMLAAMPVAADYRPLRGRTGARVVA
jgi:hypothetical protein